MPKSVKAQLSLVSDLVAICDIKIDTYPTIYISHSGPAFHLALNELAKVTKVLRIQKSKVKVERSTTGCIHVSFNARGAHFVAVILQEEQAEFFSQLSEFQDDRLGLGDVSTVKRIAAQTLVFEAR